MPRLTLTPGVEQDGDVRVVLELEYLLLVFPVLILANRDGFHTERPLPDDTVGRDVHLDRRCNGYKTHVANMNNLTISVYYNEPNDFSNVGLVLDR